MEAAEAEVGNDLCWTSIAFPLGLAEQNERCSSLGSPHSQPSRAAAVPQHHLIFAGTKCRCEGIKSVCAGEVCCAAFESVQLKMYTLNCFLDPKSVHRK